LAGLIDGDFTDSLFSCVYEESKYDGAGETIREASEAMPKLLRRTDTAALRQRRSPDAWSALEYGCHLRDVLLVQRERVLQSLRGFGNERIAMGRNERVEHDGYNQQTACDVATQIEQATVLFVGLLDCLSTADWSSTVAYLFPDPEPRSLRWIAVHTAHEAIHHLHDVRNAL
jgi:hypothetical protein